MKLKLIIPVVVSISIIACTKPNDHPETDEHSAHRAKTSGNYADSVNAEIILKDTLKGSPRRFAMDFIGSNHVHVDYGSPGVKGRTIWGGLVAYDEVWATGAHHATSIEFSKDIIIDGKNISHGKYAFFTVPGKEKWIIILNKNWDQHLADDYNETEDAVRVTVEPEISENVIQRLTFSVNKISEAEGEIVMGWEKVRVRLPFKNTR